MSTLVKCWMKRGEQKRIPTPGQQQWHHVIGAYNWRTGEIIYTTCAKKNTSSFCHFLEHFMTQVQSDKPIFYVLDNASYHHSIVSQAMIAFFEDRAIPIWLPPYCSDLNPIERFWRHLKDIVCANHLFESIEILIQSLIATLDLQNDFAYPGRLLFQNTS